MRTVLAVFTLLALSIYPLEAKIKVHKEMLCGPTAHFAEYHASQGFVVGPTTVLPDGARQEIWLHHLTGEFRVVLVSDGHTCIAAFGETVEGTDS